jgi:hypothetical protein
MGLGIGADVIVDGLITAAKGMQVKGTNLEAIEFPVRQLDE